MECARLDERAVGLEGHPVKSSACAIVVYGDGTGKLKKSCHGKHLNLDSVQAMSSRTTQFHEERGSHHAPPFSAWLSNLVVLRLCVVRWRKQPRSRCRINRFERQGVGKQCGRWQGLVWC